MLCTNCGNNLAPGHTHCNRCGAPVYIQQNPNQYQQNPYQQNPGWGNTMQGGWNNPAGQQKPQDMGFLILAIVFAAYSLVNLLTGMIGIGWELMRFVYLLLFIAEFAVLIVFTRNSSYRTIIIVIGAVLFLYRFWEMFGR